MGDGSDGQLRHGALGISRDGSGNRLYSYFLSRLISSRAQKPEGRGALMLLPMLELMRYHLDSIDGSCLDRGHPISALLLACAAVRAIFNDTFLD